MKAELACIPCIMKQAYNTALRATDDPAERLEIMRRAADYVKTVDFTLSPADSSNPVYKIAREVTGKADPYEKDKRYYNELCLGMLPDLRRRIEETGDPIGASARAAILGNLIDLGIGLEFDLDRDLKRIFDMPFGVDDTPLLREVVTAGGASVLYLGDNAGEIAFDRLLVERLAERNRVTFVVKTGPIINDATMEDARTVGITDLVEVIETGSDGIGVKWSEVTDTFLKRYREADIIISKGQGNFETMSGRKGVKFFLLRAKCESVARELGVKFGDIVLAMKKD